MSIYNWQQAMTLKSKSFTCGYCGSDVSSEKGYYALQSPSNSICGNIYICHKCGQPTFFNYSNKQWPGVIFGNSVDGIEDNSIKALYEEARTTTGVGCYTAAVLCCRKILMHIAVSKGANENLKFIDYVQYFADKHFIPPDAIEWVDHIRIKSNEANHEICVMQREDAEDLLSFIEMLLKVIYEFPSIVKSKHK